MINLNKNYLKKKTQTNYFIISNFFSYKYEYVSLFIFYPKKNVSVFIIVCR